MSALEEQLLEVGFEADRWAAKSQVLDLAAPDTEPETDSGAELEAGVGTAEAEEAEGTEGLDIVAELEAVAACNN